MIFNIYLALFVCFLAVIIPCLLKARPKKETIQERLWKKIAFSLGELFPTLDNEEKEVLRHTYVNTIHNAKPIKADITLKRTSLKEKAVTFALQNNIIHHIPNYEID
jgi:hypothetical protein